jgi:hypothetical protein
MGLFSKSPEEKAAIADMKAADAALHANQHKEQKAGIRHETPEYQRLNREANEAAAKVSFWRGGTKKGR